jgi:aryl-alcohol dehydrogenase-like predicted oxidoreductase
LTTSVIGFGALEAGGLWVGHVNDDEVVAAMQLAFDRGVTLFDTAAAYGLGHSEELLARALGSHRQEIMIATKFGIVWDETRTREHTWKDGSRERILFEVEQSLRRLQTDYIDIYQHHWPDPNTPVQETMETLLALQRAGKIRHIGVSNYDVSLMQEALRHARVACNQPRYSMLSRAVEADLLPFCESHGVGVLVYGVLQHGLLTGKFAAGHRFEPDDWRAQSVDESQCGGPSFERNLRIVDGLRPIAAARGRTLAQLAVAWSLLRPAVSCALVGAKRPSQIADCIEGAEWELTQEEVGHIDRACAIT